VTAHYADMRSALALVIATVTTLSLTPVAGAQPAPAGPVAHAAAVCADYSNQSAAQQAADTRDVDGAAYCESMPCPCSSAAGTGGGATKPTLKPKTSCIKPKTVQKITFSSTKDPTIRQHFLKASRKGWPRILVVNRPAPTPGVPGCSKACRPATTLTASSPPPSPWPGLPHPRCRPTRGWMADVAYLPSSENRSHGSTMGIKLRRFCNGTRFRYVFY
jgi:hypothetical protein